MYYKFSLNQPHRPIESIIHNVYVSVPSWKPRFPVDWRLLIENPIANIGISLLFFFFIPETVHWSNSVFES